jgi:hypothetical protein
MIVDSFIAVYRAATMEDNGDIYTMSNPPGIRLLQVDLIHLEPSLWKWEISERNLEIAHGYATSRETAQIDGDSALFEMLSAGY